MYKTAGYCTYKKNKFGIRTTKVELSVKVCDSAGIYFVMAMCSALNIHIGNCQLGDIETV